MSQQNDHIIRSQRHRLEAIVGQFVGRDAPYCILDFPDHSNVGDSAIYLGEVQLLGALTGRPASYVCTHHTFDEQHLRQAAPEGPVFIHGGGNFGDFWPEHQRFRKRLIDGLRDRTVVQLPQSISFREDAAIASCARSIDGHPDFHLLVRDANSEAFAREHFDCPVTLSPDCAFALGAFKRRAPADVEVLLLLREDHERVTHDLGALSDCSSYAIVDWLEEPRLGRFQRGLGQARALLKGAWRQSARDEMKYERLSRWRVERGLRQLSRGRGLITDRLHAHILATLLNIPHVALDNVYGKIANYVGAWTSDYAGVRLAATLPEALTKLPSLQRDFAAAPGAAADTSGATHSSFAHSR